MGAYTPPSVRTVREDVQASVVPSGGAVTAALIGLSNGKTVAVKGYEAALGATAVYTFSGLGHTIAALTEVRSKENGGLIYRATDDFTFNAGTQELTFTASALRQPAMISATARTAASSFAPATYFWVITAIRDTDETGPVVGETVASDERSVAVASGQVVDLTWTAVSGAKGYRIYRAVSSGNYTGSALVAQVLGEFTTTYTDTGTAATPGSPPGLSTYGTVLASNNPTYDIEPAQTLTVAVDGGAPQTVTFNAARASRTGSAGTFPTGFAGGETLSIAIDGGAAQVIVFTAGASALADVVNEINAAPLVGGYADTSGGQLRINSDVRGLGSSVQIVGGTGAATLGMALGTTNGSGNVQNIDAVTAAEVAAQLTAQVTGATGAVDGPTGRPRVSTDTAGGTGSINVTGGTAAATIGFAAGVNSGASAAAATALRRPALNGGDFYVDYTHITVEYYTAKRFTNLSLLLAEYGIGSRLAIGGTLYMGTAGRGNAASVCVTIAVPSDTLLSYQTAMDYLARRKDIDLVVPLSVVAGINTATLAHCTEQSNDRNRRERIGVVGPAIDTQPGDETTANTAIYDARALDSRFMIYTYPWPVVDVQQSDSMVVETELDGWATAAAVAGVIASQPDRATPATTKRVYGIKRLGRDDDEPTMDLMGGAGVCLVYDEDGQLLIRDGVTTNRDNAADREININLTDNYLRKVLRAEFRNFRGRKLLPNLLNQVQAKTKKVLAQFVKFQLISSYDPDTVVATQDEDVLTTVVVRFSYVPVFPARIIEFRYSLSLEPVALAA